VSIQKLGERRERNQKFAVRSRWSVSPNMNNFCNKIFRIYGRHDSLLSSLLEYTRWKPGGGLYLNTRKHHYLKAISEVCSGFKA